VLPEISFFTAAASNVSPACAQVENSTKPAKANLTVFIFISSESELVGLCRLVVPGLRPLL
jgi:hypothetical protein